MSIGGQYLLKLIGYNLAITLTASILLAKTRYTLLNGSFAFADNYQDALSVLFKAVSISSKRFLGLDDTRSLAVCLRS